MLHRTIFLLQIASSLMLKSSYIKSPFELKKSIFMTTLESTITKPKVLFHQENDNIHLSIFQNSNSHSLHPSAPILIQLECQKEPTDSFLYETIEKGIESLLNMGGRSNQLQISGSEVFRRYFLQMGFTKKGLGLDRELFLKHCSRRLSEVGTSTSVLHNIFGRLSHETENYDEAIKSYTASLQITPSSIVFKNLGAAYHAKQEFQFSFASYQQAIELNKNDSSVYLKLAHLYEDLAQKDWLEAASNAKKCYEYYLSSVKYEDLAALIRFGNFLVREHETELAIEIYNKALLIDENSASSWFNKAFAEIKLQKLDDSRKSLHRVVSLDSSNLAALHMLNALDETKAIQASSMNEAYVINLFNNYADEYDNHFRKMKYSIPRLVRTEISRIYNFDTNEHQPSLNTCAEHSKDECDSHAPSFNATLNVLDLGCGTGLVGSFLKDFSRSIVGVDISPGMTDVCRKKKVYSKLQVESINDYLIKNKEKFDVIVAAELFSYIGDLKSVFDQMGKAMSVGSHFVFTVEEVSPESCLPGREFKLLQSGRFGYSEMYLNKLIESNGQFSLLSCKPISSRYEFGEQIQGFLYILSKKRVGLSSSS